MMPSCETPEAREQGGSAGENRGDHDEGDVASEALRAAIRETKVGGLQWEATGLFLVTIGAASAALPSVFCPT